MSIPPHLRWDTVSSNVSTVLPSGLIEFSCTEVDPPDGSVAFIFGGRHSVYGSNRFALSQKTYKLTCQRSIIGKEKILTSISCEVVRVDSFDPQQFAPTFRHAHTACYYPAAMQIVIFGGQPSLSGYHFSNDVLLFDVNSSDWLLDSTNGGYPLSTRLVHACQGSVPPPRAAHSACIAGHRMFVFGGRSGGTGKLLRDLYFLDLPSKTWFHVHEQSLSGPAPTPRVLACITPVVRKEGMLRMYSGGLASSATTTTQTNINNENRSGDFNEVVSSSEVKGLIIIGGYGRTSSMIMTDAFHLDLSSMRWTKTSSPTNMLPQGNRGIFPLPISHGGVDASIDTSGEVGDTMVLLGYPSTFFSFNPQSWLTTNTTAQSPSLLTGTTSSKPPTPATSVLRTWVADSPPFLLNQHFFYLKNLPIPQVVMLNNVGGATASVEGDEKMDFKLQGESKVNNEHDDDDDETDSHTVPSFFDAPSLFYKVSDIWFSIFEFLPLEAVCRCGRICQHAHISATDDYLWDQKKEFGDFFDVTNPVFAGMWNASNNGHALASSRITPRQKVLFGYRLMKNLSLKQVKEDFASKGKVIPLLPMIMLSVPGSDKVTSRMDFLPSQERLCFIGRDDSSAPVSLLNVGSCADTKANPLNSAKKMAILEETASMVKQPSESGGSMVWSGSSDSTTTLPRSGSNTAAMMMPTASSSSRCFPSKTQKSDPIYATSWTSDPWTGQMAFGTIQSKIMVMDSVTGAIRSTLKGHSKTITKMRFVDPNILVSGSFDTTLRVWNLNDPRKELCQCTSHIHAVDNLWVDAGPLSKFQTNQIFSTSKPFPGFNAEAIFHDIQTGKMVHSITTLPKTGSFAGIMTAFWTSPQCVFLVASDVCMLYDIRAGIPASGASPLSLNSTALSTRFPTSSGNTFFETACPVSSSGDHLFLLGGGVRRTFDEGILSCFDARMFSSVISSATAPGSSTPTLVPPVFRENIGMSTISKILPIVKDYYAISSGQQVFSVGISPSSLSTPLTVDGGNASDDDSGEERSSEDEEERFGITTATTTRKRVPKKRKNKKSTTKNNAEAAAAKWITDPPRVIMDVKSQASGALRNLYFHVKMDPVTSTFSAPLSASDGMEKLCTVDLGTRMECAPSLNLVSGSVIKRKQQTPPVATSSKPLPSSSVRRGSTPSSTLSLSEPVLPITYSSHKICKIGIRP